MQGHKRLVKHKLPKTAKLNRLLSSTDEITRDVNEKQCPNETENRTLFYVRKNIVTLLR